MQIGPPCRRLDWVVAFLPAQKICHNANGVTVLPRDFVTLVVLALTAILCLVVVGEESGVDWSGQAIRKFAKKALSDNGAPTWRQYSDILDPLPINVAFAVGLSRIEHPNLEGSQRQIQFEQHGGDAHRAPNLLPSPGVGIEP